MPFSRRSVRAASRSPLVSCSARLQSIIPAPVSSRSSLTSAAEISVIAPSPSRVAAVATSSGCGSGSALGLRLRL